LSLIRSAEYLHCRLAGHRAGLQKRTPRGPVLQSGAAWQVVSNRFRANRRARSPCDKLCAGKGE